MATPYALSQALLRAGDAWSQAVERFLQERFGISHAQFLVLDHLKRNPGSKQGDLADTLGRTKGNMTGVLGRLEDAGLVRRDRVEGNRRAYALSLTEKGEMVTLVAPELTSLAQHLLGDLTAAERTVLARGLEHLEQSLAASGLQDPEPPIASDKEEHTEVSALPSGPPVLVDPRRHREVRVVSPRAGERERRAHGPGPTGVPGDKW